MKRIDSIKKEYLEEYEVNINQVYLTAKQIELIATNMMSQAKNYAEEIYVRDLLILQLCTDITEEEIKEYDHDYFVQCGLIDAVLRKIKNLYHIDNYIKQARNVSIATVTFLNTLSESLDKYGKKLPNSKQLAEMVKAINDIQIPK